MKNILLKIRSLILFLPICLFAQVIDSNKSLESTPPLFDEVNVNIDGFLDEEPWSKSLFLSKFTSYLPVDGRPAEDDTQIKIWYSTKALYIGITAWEIHDEVRSTLADRDNLENDDYIKFINVWSSWCIPCRAEHEVLKIIAKIDNVEIYGINYKDNEQEVKLEE